MKRILSMVLCVLFLSGCSSAGNGIDPAMELRNTLLNADGCSFIALITADYGDELYSFTMECEFDKEGTMRFTVLEPETINGISGLIDSEGGALTFDDKVLAFPMLADDMITPVSAPWLLIRSVRSGYLVACGKDQTGYQIQIDDSYEENALQLDLWTDQQMNITRGEFLWDGRRVLSIEVSAFKML